MMNADEKKITFTNQQLAAIIIPLILEQILSVTIGMADTLMVARVGEEAVSGVSLVDSINILLTNIFLAFSTGGAVVAAQALGEKNPAKARHAASQLILSITGLATIIMILSLAGNSLILRAVFGNVEELVMQNASIYFYITVLSFPFMAIQNGASALLRVMGNTRITMYVSFVLNLINIAGNAFFLLVLHWNAAGVATATLISRMTGALILWIILKNKKRDIYFGNPLRWRIDFAVIKRIMQIGIPTGIDNVIFQVGKILVQSLVVSFGTAAIAANAIVGMVAGCAYIPGNAVGITFLTVIGQLVGAGDYESARKYVVKLVSVSIGVMAVFNMIILLANHNLVGLYHLSPEGTMMAEQVITYHSIAAILLWSLAFTLPNALRAADDTQYSMVVSILSMWVFRVGLSYLFGRNMGMGLLGVWVAMSVDWVFRAVCFIYRIASGKWLRHHVRLVKKEQRE